MCAVCRSFCDPLDARGLCAVCSPFTMLQETLASIRSNHPALPHIAKTMSQTLLVVQSAISRADQPPTSFPIAYGCPPPHQSSVPALAQSPHTTSPQIAQPTTPADAEEQDKELGTVDLFPQRELQQGKASSSGLPSAPTLAPSAAPSLQPAEAVPPCIVPVLAQAPWRQAEQPKQEQQRPEPKQPVTKRQPHQWPSPISARPVVPKVEQAKRPRAVQDRHAKARRTDSPSPHEDAAHRLASAFARASGHAEGPKQPGPYPPTHDSHTAV